jgi:hypothetical protein
VRVRAEPSDARAVCDRQLSFEVHRLDEADKTLATSDELTLIREVVDLKSRRRGSIGIAKLPTPLAELVGVEHPVARTGMGRVAARDWCPRPLTPPGWARVGPP